MTEMDSLENVTGGMQNNRAVVWQPSEGDSVKLNFDTCYNSQSNRSALVFVEELGFRKIVVEGDTLTVTKKSSKSSNTWTGTGRKTIRFPDVLDRGGPARVEELADLDRGRLNEEERMGND
ncbi:hypothetical protein Gotri_012845 [Gossypium trilobum]|uniref:Uncharacterized protein n=1 Tax=Gossypium trilobum TaxID=34281 RepID=A0A7J9DRT0_9ROSI|nr:hypothetical protein [Gossypium trilobum]